MYILIKRTRVPYYGGERYSPSKQAEMNAATLDEAIEKARNHPHPIGYEVYLKVAPGQAQERVWPEVSPQEHQEHLKWVREEETHLSDRSCEEDCWRCMSQLKVRERGLMMDPQDLIDIIDQSDEEIEESLRKRGL